MDILVLDVLIIIYLVVGTVIIKKLQKLVSSNKLSKNKYLIITLFPGVVPLVVLQTETWNYSAMAVVAAGVCFFWFPILASRSTANAT